MLYRVAVLFVALRRRENIGGEADPVQVLVFVLLVLIGSKFIFLGGETRQRNAAAADLISRTTMADRNNDSDSNSGGYDPSSDPNPLSLSPSANDILDVTPVNSFSDDKSDEDQGNSPHSNTSRNEDAFSSDSDEQRSEDEENSEFADDGDDLSEWDKALMTGRPSKGHASDFFAAPSHSGDSTEFLTLADQEVLREASTAGDETTGHTSSSESRPTRPRPPSPSASSQGPPIPPPIPPPPAPAPTSPIILRRNQSFASSIGTSHAGNSTARPSINSNGSAITASSGPTMRPHPADDDDLSSGVLPDVLMTMRQKIESLTLFDSDMMRLATNQEDDDPMWQESRESLKRSSQQSISAAVLVSLAHKRYERRRLGAMEIEKMVRSLVQQNELDRVRAILLLLSDDYVRSTSEDARKGGVVALAACAIGLKKANDEDPAVQECRDLILASVVHACQDHSQRVRYYATESLFNVVKVIPSLAVQHFFILFEILRSLYADVDADVRSGAELLDKKLKEVIVIAMNSGSFTADSCVPVFARFVHMRNKATKRLTLTWLQELNEKLIGAPILEFLHLFLGGIFDMVADPTVAIRQSALAFLQSVLPKLLVMNSEAIDDMDDQGMKVDFDKILQSLVTSMEHPSPFVRKVAMYWMSRIVKAHMSAKPRPTEIVNPDGSFNPREKEEPTPLSPASVSVLNSLPHVLPGILLSIGDEFHNNSSAKDSFLPDQTTRALAEQTNTCLQDAVRRDGQAYVQHLDGFIVALREELDSPGGLSARNPPAIERTNYRMDVNKDGTGIESGGWFRASTDTKDRSDDSMIMSRLCALHWVIVLYQSVVPDVLKADYAREFVFPIIHQLVDTPPELIVYKSLEVLAKITIPVAGESIKLKRPLSSGALSGLGSPAWALSGDDGSTESVYPMTDSSVHYALEILDSARRKQKSRDREVFAALIQLYSFNEHLIVDLSSVITYMCKLQPPEFVFVSFAVELDRFIRRRASSHGEWKAKSELSGADNPFSSGLRFVSSFVQHMNHVLLNAEETKEIRVVLKDCIGAKEGTERDLQRSRLFHILLHSFSHNLVSTLSLCLWAGAYRTGSLFLNHIDPLDIDLMFLLEVDRLVELLERPLFRHLHVRMLELDKDPKSEGSGAMLFQALKSLLLILPQSTCYNVLKDRLVSTSRFRQSTIAYTSINTFSANTNKVSRDPGAETKLYVTRIEKVRSLHCTAAWQTIRAESLEIPTRSPEQVLDEGAGRRKWLGYATKEEDKLAQQKFQEEKKRQQGEFAIEEVGNTYHDLVDSVSTAPPNSPTDAPSPNPRSPAAHAKTPKEDVRWKGYWENTDGV